MHGPSGKTVTLAELAGLAGGRVSGDGSVEITGVASIDEAGPGDVTLLADPRHSGKLSGSKASAVIVPEGAKPPSGVPCLVAKNPQLAFAHVLEALRPAERPGPGVSPRAEVHESAELGPGVHVGPFAVVGAGAKVGENTVVSAGVYIGPGATVGRDSLLHPGVAVRERCVLGDRVVVHCNTVIGSDGFGFAKDGVRYHKVPQTGTVRVGDDVEIGACVTIDRATLDETVIGRGTKVDNLVQIAHNVKVGEDTVIVAQVGISGSTTVGSRVQLAGQVGVVGHIEIGDDSMVGAKSGVTGKIPPRSGYSGIPAIPHREWLKAQSIYAKLPEMRAKIRELEKRLKDLEDDQSAESGD